MAGAAKDRVQQEAAHFADSAKDTLRQTAEQQKASASEAIGDFSRAIRRAGEDLAQNDRTMAGHMVKQAADGLGDLAHTLADKRPEELVEVLRDFGRSNPVAFAAGAALLGIALGRVVRATAETPAVAGAVGSADQPQAASMGAEAAGVDLGDGASLASAPAEEWQP
jgi:hypothetical protein